jgi:hypothetical protein
MGHTTIRNENLFCLNCGESHKLVYPIGIKEMSLKIKSFEDLHKDCLKTWVEPQADMSQSESARIKWWLENGEKGLSSKAMLWICYGEGKVDTSHPYDPSDFLRCHELVKVVPEIKERFHILKEAGKEWSSLVDNWDKLAELLEEQLQSGKDNGMYEFMKTLIN